MLSIQTPTGYTLEPVTLSFTEYNNSLITDYWNYWMDLIVDPVTGVVSYRLDHAKDITIVRKDQQDTVKWAVKLLNAYPKTVNSVELSDKSNDETVEVTVLLEYEDYRILASPLAAKAQERIIGR